VGGIVAAMVYMRIDGDPDPGRVRRLTFVLFDEDGTAFGFADGRPGLPSGTVEPGEDWLLDSSLRIPLMTAGFRPQRVHPVAIDGDHLYAFLEGAPYRGRREHVAVDLVELPPEELANRLDPVLARFVRDAAESFRNQSEESYYADNTRLLEPAYLRGTTAEEGSGSGATPEQWRVQREPIVDGIDRDGTFLDLGCANGHLMDSVRRWAGERGFTIEPYGADIGPRLVELARQRLPHWKDRIWVGNALTWTPPDGRRFTYVHLLVDFVLPHRRSDLIRHCLDTMVEPGGRLLVSHYAYGGQATAAEIVTELGFPIAGASGDTVWIDA
jgi:2-polyprenyl-3-methyl-5-hydroxy-6-metoxy-1,4-benzoquinol methylase